MKTKESNTVNTADPVDNHSQIIFDWQEYRMLSPSVISDFLSFIFLNELNYVLMCSRQSKTSNKGTIQGF